ncbi:MAG: hypothetical protein H0V96_13355 [Acidimicrobiia bacterium]|nr:hypothetical protein [Acidimicrobiia bacterium]
MVITTSYHFDYGLTYQSGQYDLNRTIYLAISLQDASNALGNDLHRVTFFNDADVIREVDEVEFLVNHDDHLHARFCTEYHPFDARYDCVN